MIFTDDDDLYEKMVSNRVHGKGTDKYDNIRVGVNGRLDTMQVAVLLAKMEVFDKEIGLCQDVAVRYSDALRDTVEVPRVKKDNVSAWAQYSVLHPERDKMLQKLREQGVPSAIYYQKPLHLQTAFTHLGYEEGAFPVAERLAQEVFSIPMYPYLKNADQDKIISAITAVPTFGFRYLVIHVITSY